MSFVRPTFAELRQLVRLAVPVVIVQLAMMAMGVEDVMIVGRYSPAALAGIAIGAMYNFTLGAFGFGLVLGLEPIIAQAVGARDEPAIARAFQRGLVIVAVIGTCVLLLTMPSAHVLRLLGQPREIVDVAAPYLDVTAWGQYGFLLFGLLRVTLQSRGITRPILVSILFANVVNVVLSILLVFGLAGCPRMGPVGSGVGTLVARIVMVVVLLVAAWGDLGPLFRWRPDVLAWGPVSRVLALGLPVGLQLLLEFGVFAIVGLAMGNLGALPMAGHQIALNIASLTYMVPLGVSTAGSVLVGQAIGAGDAARARRMAVGALGLGVGFMALSATTFLLVPALLARAYSNDPGVVALAATLIPIAGVFQVFDGTQVVGIGVLRGAGDTRAPMIVNLVGYWFVGLPVALWLGRGLGLGPRGMWWGLVAGLAAVAIIVLARVRHRLAGELRRLHIDGEHPPAATH